MAKKVITLSPAQLRAAEQIADGIVSVDSANAGIGAIIRGIKITADAVPAFQAAVAAGLAGRVAEPTAKVYTSRIGGVLRALASGWKPAKDCTSLSALYAAAPKGSGKNKGGRPRKDASAEGEADATTEPANPDKGKNATVPSREAAIKVLFGHVDTDLVAAVEYAVAHELMFMNWAHASASASQKPAKLKKAA